MVSQARWSFITVSQGRYYCNQRAILQILVAHFTWCVPGPGLRTAMFVNGSDSSWSQTIKKEECTPCMPSFIWMVDVLASVEPFRQGHNLEGTYGITSSLPHIYTILRRPTLCALCSIPTFGSGCMCLYIRG